MTALSEWIEEEREIWRNDIDGYSWYNVIPKYLKIIELMSETLEWYADRKNWKEDNIFVAYKKYPNEGSGIARQTLEDIQKEIECLT